MLGPWWGRVSIIVAARSYLADVEPPRPVGNQARVARYAWVDHYAPLRVGLRAMAGRLRAADERAVAFADDNAIVDREVAHRAGLGWFGKSANLLVAGAGSWFVLGCVITTAELPVATAVVADGCGPCSRCLDACPTGAIVAPGVVDANRCLAWVLQTPGCHPRSSSVRRSATACTAATTARRPARPRSTSAGVTAGRSTTGRGRGSTCSTCWPPTMRPCSTAMDGGTSPGVIRGGCGATRW